MELQAATVSRRLYASSIFVVLVALLCAAFSFFVLGQLEDFRRDVARMKAVEDEILLEKELLCDLADLRQLITDAALTKYKGVISEKAAPTVYKALRDVDKLIEIRKKTAQQPDSIEDLKKDLSSFAAIPPLEFYAKSEKVISEIGALADRQAADVEKQIGTIKGKVGRVLHFISIFMIAAGISAVLFAVFLAVIGKSVKRMGSRQ